MLAAQAMARRKKKTAIIDVGETPNDAKASDDKVDGDGDADEVDEVDEDEEPKADIEEGADTDLAAGAVVPDEVLEDGADEVVPAAKGRSIARRDPMAVYMRETRRFPLLTPDEEKALATRLVEHGDRTAARKLIEANLRLVVKIAYEYRRAHKNLLDLVQEGNIGLIQAVSKFDPYRGVKLSSYAAFWIRAYILKFILNNWRLVKIGTTQAQRKLFFNLRSMKQSLKDDVDNVDTHRSTLTQGEVDKLARTLNVKREEVLEMETRLSGGAVALEPQTADSEESFAPIAYLADEASEPTRVLEARKRDWLASDGIALALATLDERSKRIVEERWLKVNDDSSGGMTLHDLADQYGVRAERIRQSEVAAMKKMRKARAESV